VPAGQQVVDRYWTMDWLEPTLKSSKLIVFVQLDFSR
jgi:hypothetical protein